MADETVMDAVNAALDGTAVETPEPVESPTAHEAVGDETLDPLLADAPESEETDAEAEARGAERNADGTFKKRAKTEEPEAEKVKDPATKEPVKAAEPKKADPLNDPIPKDLKVETQERIRTLIKTTKEITAERDAVKTDFEYLVNGVQATGATPQQYGETLQWLAAFNSGDPAQQEKALEMVEAVADRLATLLGKERTVGDPLAQHADLKEAVAKGQVTPQYAKEIARTRNSQGLQRQFTEQHTAEQRAAQAAEQAQLSARASLTELGNTLAATDPLYEQKRAMLVPIMKPIFANLSPAQWRPAFEQAYANLRLSAPAAARASGTNQPLRANKAPAGGQGRAPGSMREALDAALGGMK
jgi:hypothetical protein